MVNLHLRRTHSRTCERSPLWPIVFFFDAHNFSCSCIYSSGHQNRRSSERKIMRKSHFCFHIYVLYVAISIFQTSQVAKLSGAGRSPLSSFALSHAWTHGSRISTCANAFSCAENNFKKLNEGKSPLPIQRNFE